MTKKWMSHTISAVQFMHETNRNVIHILFHLDNTPFYLTMFRYAEEWLGVRVRHVRRISGEERCPCCQDTDLESNQVCYGFDKAKLRELQTFLVQQPSVRLRMLMELGDYDESEGTA